LTGAGIKVTATAICYSPHACVPRRSVGGVAAEPALILLDLARRRHRLAQMAQRLARFAW